MFRCLAKYSPVMQTLLHIARALGDENRIRLLMALRSEELCACQLTELLGLAPSTVSKHLSLLAQAGLVQQRKQGRWMYFRLPDADAPTVVREALDWVRKAAARKPRILEDRQHLTKIIQQDPSELCKRQCHR